MDTRKQSPSIMPFVFCGDLLFCFVILPAMISANRQNSSVELRQSGKAAADAMGRPEPQTPEQSKNALRQRIQQLDRQIDQHPGKDSDWNDQDFHK